MDHRLDDIDRRVLHALMEDARNAAASALAEELDVSSATIRNRIAKLEEAGVISGYHADVDFERADGRLTNLYLCNAPVADRESVAARVRGIPGVVNVRELMTGRRNLHVLAVGEDIADLRRIARAISGHGAEIEDEDLVQAETHLPYAPYGPDDARESRTFGDFASLGDGSELVEVTVEEGSRIAGKTLSEVGERGLLGGDVLVVAIGRTGEAFTPHGDTLLRADDSVTLFARGGVSDEMLAEFRSRR